MVAPFHLYAFFMFSTSAITASLAWYALNRRKIVSQALPFALITVTATVWTLGYGMRLASTTLDAKLFWQRVIYLGNTSVPLAYLVFSLVHAQQHRWLNRWALALLGLPVALTILAVFTNDWHHLVWRRQWLERDLLNIPGPVYWFHTAYAYLYVLVSMVVLWRARGQASWLQRSQATLLAVGIGIPFIVSLLTDVLGWDVIPMFDEPTASVLFSSLVLAWAIFRYKALDIVPIAHSIVIQNIEDGIFVLDPHLRLVYLNPAGLRLSGAREARVIGQPFEQVLAHWSERALQAWEKGASEVEIDSGRETPARYFELRRLALNNEKNLRLGSLVIFHDISERKQFERQLRALATTDPLTGCYNRRYFMDLATLEVDRSVRYQRPVALLIMDIDHFKQVNDTHGHAAGDQVLISLVKLCLQDIRQTDIFARYGGEEFVLLFPETSCEMGRQVAERIRRLIETTSFQTDAGALHVTVSIGLAGMPDSQLSHIDALLAKADQALYASKEAGRNCVRTM
jgi:diguanylate cyclase (GGDEF)-like protein/PAS domain S-box-containing protein